MALFFVYILKSSLCLALFYLFYRLLLSNETFHKFNRFALLGLLILSCLVPFIEVTTQETTEVQQSLLTLEEWLLLAQYEAEAMVSAETVTVFNHSAIGWREALLLIYWVGILFFFVRALYSITKMLLLIKSGKRVKHDGSSLIIHNKEVAPFSWMRYIVISEKDYSENGKEIITHEQAHIAKRHSWDLLAAQVCLFFQWFNPAAWLLKQELQNIHEYQADSSVINQGIDAKQYQLLLIKKAVGPRLYSMANSFNHHSLKKRIAMMLKQKSSPWARAKFLYVLPLAAVAVAAFARPEVSNELNEISAVKVTNLTEKVTAEVVKSIENPLSEATPIAALTHSSPAAASSAAVTASVSASVVPSTAPAETVATTAKVSASTVPATDQDVPKKSATANAGDQVFRVVEQMPEYEGGMEACRRFIAQNMVYPAKAKEEKIQGRVIVQFVVSKEGTVRDVEVVRSIHEALDAEAIRVVSSMPAWTPGKQRGVAVDVKYTMPITFSLDDSKATSANRVVVNAPAEAAKGVASKDNMPQITAISQDGVQVVGQVYNSVDVMPSYEGGMKGVLDYLEKETKYPKRALEEKAQGRVIVQFVVSKDGSLRDFIVVRGIHAALDGEAIRVLSSMPKWTPGMQDGQAVDVKYTLPIAFKLPDSEGALNPSKTTVREGETPNLLYLVNGEVVSEISTLAPSSIGSIEILKGESAQVLLEKHNATDKSAVAVVTLKQ